MREITGKAKDEKLTTGEVKVLNIKLSNLVAHVKVLEGEMLE